MVKVKTKPETNQSKVTLADLNANILNLTAAVKGNSEIIKTAAKNIISNSPSLSSTSTRSSSSFSSSKKDKESWIGAAGKEVWRSTSTQRGYMGSTIVGGLTGISPALVQKMGLDKAVGSILKSALGGIKKKWAEAGQSNSKKVNSAIESNKNAGTNKRLDKIIGLLKNKNGVTKTEEKQKKSLFGRILGFVGSILGPLLKIAAGVAILAGISQMLNRILDKFGIKGNPTHVAEEVGIGGKSFGAGAKTAGEIMRNLAANENRYTKALRDLHRSDEFKKLKPSERAKLLGKNSKDVKVSRNLRNLVNEVQTSERILDEGSGTKALKDRIKIRAAKYVDGVEPLVKNEKPSFWNRTKAATKNYIPKSMRTAGGKILEFTGKAVDKAAKPVYISATGLEVGSDIIQGDYREAVRDTTGAWGGWKAAGWGAMKAASTAKSPGGAIVKGIGGGIIAGYAGEKITRAGTDVLMNLALGPEEKKKLSNEQIEQKRNDLDALIKGQESKIYKAAENDFKRRNAIVGAMRHTEKIPEIIEQYGLSYNEFIDEYVKSSVRGRPEAKRKAAIHNLQAAGIMPITEEGWKVPMVMPGTYLNTDFSSPIKAADEAAGTAEGIEANTRTTNDYLADILASIQNLRGDTAGYHIHRSINDQSTKMNGNEQPNTNTDFPNPLGRDNLIQFMSTHGRMGG